MRRRHAMVTMASPGLIVQGTAPWPGRSDEPGLSGSLESSPGCRDVQTGAGRSANMLYAWFDNDEALLKCWFERSEGPSGPPSTSLERSEGPSGPPSL